LRVTRKNRESVNVTSLVLEPTDGQPLTAALPGSYRVAAATNVDAPALLRSYSLSGEPSEDCYRVSIKREPTASLAPYIDSEVRLATSSTRAHRAAASR